MSKILRSIPAVIAPDGSVTLSEPVVLRAPAEAVVTILVQDGDEAGDPTPALLSEHALADWNRPEEDDAWDYLSEVI